MRYYSFNEKRKFHRDRQIKLENKLLENRGLDSQKEYEQLKDSLEFNVGADYVVGINGKSKKGIGRAVRSYYEDKRK